jgi:hypothetical protein
VDFAYFLQLFLVDFETVPTVGSYFETVPTVGSYFAFYFIAVRFISNRFNNSIFSIESLTKTAMLVVF